MVGPLKKHYYLASFFVVSLLHVPVRRVRDEGERDEEDDRDAAANDGHVVPGHDGAEAVRDERTQSHDRHGQAAEPAAMLWLSNFGDVNLCKKVF